MTSLSLPTQSLLQLLHKLPTQTPLPSSLRASWYPHNHSLKGSLCCGTADAGSPCLPLPALCSVQKGQMLGQPCTEDGWEKLHREAAKERPNPDRRPGRGWIRKTGEVHICGFLLGARKQIADLAKSQPC